MKPHQTAKEPHLNKRKSHRRLPLRAKDFVFVFTPILRSLSVGVMVLDFIIELEYN